MNIYEFQAKAILKAHGVCVPDGVVADSPEDGFKKAQNLSFPLVVKAQVHAGGRGKAGAIKVVSGTDELKEQLPAILGMRVKDLKVKKVLIEKALMIKKEFYLGIILDRSKRANALIASAQGGVDIEEVAAKSPKKVFSAVFKSRSGLESGTVAEIASSLGLSGQMAESFAALASNLYQIYESIDAQLVEINPLVWTESGEWIACDAKITIDDNALFRHEELIQLKEEAEDNDLEIEAHKSGLAYVKLPGDIGIIGNGAGLVMTTMDEVKTAGGRPANFLDIGGGAKSEVMQNALRIIYMDRDVKGIFINIFGGITRCDEVAKGMIEALKTAPADIPVVLRLAGTQAEEGQRLLKDAQLAAAASMEEGARKIVSLTKDRS